jgi:nucleotide-binding universal stress UspA family protein
MIWALIAIAINRDIQGEPVYIRCDRLERHGRPEREVVSAADGAGLLILARDGDRSRLGPRSIGKATRFVVDHAPCPVLLVWPEASPGIATIPPPPPGEPGQGPRHRP